MAPPNPGILKGLTKDELIKFITEFVTQHDKMGEQFKATFTTLEARNQEQAATIEGLQATYDEMYSDFKAGFLDVNQTKRDLEVRNKQQAATLEDVAKQNNILRQGLDSISQELIKIRNRGLEARERNQAKDVIEQIVQQNNVLGHGMNSVVGELAKVRKNLNNCEPANQSAGGVAK